MALTKAARNTINKLVQDSKRLLFEEVESQLQEFYGIRPDGSVIDIESLTTNDPAIAHKAELLRQRLDYLKSNIPDAKTREKESFAQLVREQAFTILNRLASLRMAEERDIIRESIRQGYNSEGFLVFDELTGKGKTTSLYRRYTWYIYAVFDELARDLPAVFDRFSPYALIFPEEDALLQLLDIFNEEDIVIFREEGQQPVNLWQEDETIGWIYQYYNSREEISAMRDASNAPRNSRELAVRNQFFTPRYVVQFLTDNSLGRIWYEMTKGKTCLTDFCEYLVQQPNEVFLEEGEQKPLTTSSSEEEQEETIYIEHRPLKDPRDISMIDPACGSMHFGLYAFDLYEKIYLECWDQHRELIRPIIDEHQCVTREAYARLIPSLIIRHNIHGVDIDPRAVQIAGLSLWLRAQKSYQRMSLPPADRPAITKANIVCAEPMPGDKRMLQEFLQNIDRPLRPLVEKIWEQMKLAGETGLLLKIEEELKSAIEEAREDWSAYQQQVSRMGKDLGVQVDLFEDMEQKELREKKSLYQNVKADFFEQAESLVLKALQYYAESASEGSAYQKHLFAEDTARGFAFIDLCRKGYDVVLMNPPFGKYNKNISRKLKEVFPNSFQDIAYSFIDRGIEFTKLRKGFVGAITTRTGFFLSTFEDWRKEIMELINLMADLGYGVLDAVVETAAYVIASEKTNRKAAIINLLEGLDKQKILRENIKSQRKSNVFFLCDLSYLSELPGAPLAYWAPKELMKSYIDNKSLEPKIGVVKRGVATGDNERFLRLFWEVSDRKIGSNKKWIWYAKGGKYSPYFISSFLLLNYENKGKELTNFYNLKGRLRSRPQNLEYFFQKGIAYASRTTSGFGPRILPADHGFDQTSNPIIIKDGKNIFAYLAFLLTRPILAFVELAVGAGDTSQSGTAARDYTNGIIGKIPIPDLPESMIKELNSIGKEITKLSRNDSKGNEVSIEYSYPIAIRDVELSIKENLENYVIQKIENKLKILELSFLADNLAIKAFDLGNESIDFLDSFVGVHPCSYDLLDSQHDEKILQVPTRVETKKCYWADRELELLSHKQKTHPSLLISDNGLKEQYISKMLAKEAVSLVSFLVGCSFGRWNLNAFLSKELIIDEKPLLSSLPERPPLQNESLNIGSDFLFKINKEGILASDSQREFDIGDKVYEVARHIWGARVEKIESEICAILKVYSLESYVLKTFFNDHLEMYTKSKRFAPVFWILSSSENSFEIWLHYPKINDQTLYQIVNDFVDPKLERIRKEVAQLRQREETNPRLNELRGLEEELEEFKAEILRVAQLPYKPNHDDGVLITAAPLHKLFRHNKWRKATEDCWEKLEEGEYDWAHLAYGIWPERVREKCKTDLSMAIAHGLEDICEVEPKKKKQRKKKVKKENKQMKIGD